MCSAICVNVGFRPTFTQIAEQFQNKRLGWDTQIAPIRSDYSKNYPSEGPKSSFLKQTFFTAVNSATQRYGELRFLIDCLNVRGIMEKGIKEKDINT